MKLEIFDLLGRKVRVLAESRYPAGHHGVDWNRLDAAGATVKPGIYLYRLTAGSFRGQKKMVVLP